MSDQIILKDTVKWNIAMIEDILKHPEQWGSGTKEQWENELKKLKQLLKEA